ncbi:MAG: metallophosphoesterase family protein [Defluviitaleaceae bacterium]|nr:metallophosphoesterase family protein [Defluviitaleaceae bacterium]
MDWSKAKPVLFLLRKCTIIITLILALIHLIHALTLDRIIEYNEVPFTSPRWPEALDGYRIAFISDTHNISARRLQSVVDELNNREIDMLLIGGDLWAHYERVLDSLAGIETTDGIFGVEGNHDCHVRLFTAMEGHGMVPLSNSGQQIRKGFWLAGVEDLWNRRACIATAIKDAENDDFVLLLSHNPDVTNRQCTTGVDLVVSGHTHAGQIRFLGLWAPFFTFTNIITNYGQRFVSGWATSRDGVPVYVSNGTGNVVPRVFARPQVIIFTMHSKCVLNP